ncbi:DUF427 domain-containing protein [Caulobacter hibisci]|uniref:DUF427 domain-containing protein n=1 Tax=Caulobacter hibisci TaxID=2035993 RepID=A0ABS0SZ19_9CAUL|nr:DUF427 domain-containing protein [Caulobacter hibisci]MBI1684511.1 DUF427 domain-containing protein [Caulobacter hibisci]
MQSSNPDHPITGARESGRVRVLFEGHEIADSDDVLVLREADYPPVRYFPREDVATAFLRKTDHTTRCPYKGQATYYTIYRDGRIVEDAVWSYETPLPGMERIAGRLAFYPEHVVFQADALSPAEAAAIPSAAPGAAPLNARDIDEVVRHTDSGSGHSQAEHWDANVSMPDEGSSEGKENRDLGRPYHGTGSI